MEFDLNLYDWNNYLINWVMLYNNKFYNYFKKEYWINNLLNYKIIDWYANIINLSDKIIFVNYKISSSMDLTYNNIERDIFSKSEYTKILNKNTRTNE